MKMVLNNYKFNILFSVLFIFVLTCNCSNDKSTNPSNNTAEGELVISFPSNNSTVSGIVTISAAISENVSIDNVEFYIDENLKYTSTSSPFEFVWNTLDYADSTYHIIQLKGYEGNILKSTSDIITVRIINSGAVTDTTAPTLSITNPSNGETISGTVNITLQASDDNGVKQVKIYIDGSEVSTGYSYDWNTTTYANGSHSIYAKAWDYSNNEGTSTSINVITNNQVTDTTPPTLSITHPLDATTISGTVNIAVQASDDTGVKEVKIYIDGNEINTGYSYSWNTTDYENGSHSIYAKAWDYSNNEGTSEIIYVTINNFQDSAPPTIIITYPINNSTISGEIRISGTANDNDKLQRIYLYIDGALKKNYNNLNSSSYNIYYDWDTNLIQDGLHNIYASAKDQSGNETLSSEVVITSKNSPDMNQNVILGGGFEESNIDDYWDISYFGGVYEDKNEAHTGSHYYYSKDVDSWTTTRYTFHVENQQKYELEFWAKGNADVSVKLLYENSNTIEIVNINPNSSDWIQVKQEIVITEEIGIASIRIYVDWQGYIDDISFTRKQ